ncbi:MAG: IS21 family transposase [Planctomycetota bacterium]|jgi:transposase
MEKWVEIRRDVLVGGKSKRQVQRETGLAWKTLEKILTHSSPPGYRRTRPYPKPKLGPYLDRIARIIEADRDVPRKQRHTAKRIYERIRDEGYQGRYTQVKAAVRAIKRTKREVFFPLVHRPGEAQVDLGEALVKEAGVLRRIAFFVIVLPHSDAIYVQVFDHECMEVWWEGHLRAFEFFGGVPWRITADNASPLVAKVIGPHERELTAGFLQFKSHYLFDTHFCRVRRANEKGVAENMVRYSRQNFLVPVPQVASLEELNRQLEERCRRELSRKLRGKTKTKGELLEKDRRAFLELPAARFDACRKRSTCASSMSLVRFERNDYSVPVRHAYQPVVVKGYVDRVEIYRNGERIARHERLWTRGDASYDPLHYLELLERKPGALDHARPFEGWELPECFDDLRRRLDAQYGADGKRDYIQVLMLLGKYPVARLAKAVKKAVIWGAIRPDAVKQFLFDDPDLRSTSFTLDGREHLKAVEVSGTDVSAYGDLLRAGGAL